MAYAIISLGGKQYRVHEGERLLVDRLAEKDGATLSPKVLLIGGDGTTDIAPKDAAVTARVVGDMKGPKIRIGKYKQRTGHHKHTGFRASLTQIEIQSIGAKAKPAAKPKAAAAAAEAKPKAATTAAEEKPKTTVKPKAAAKTPAKPKAPTAAKPKAPAKPKAVAAKAPAAKAKPTPKPAAAKNEES